jgi:GntR family transcriptional regulator
MEAHDMNPPALRIKLDFRSGLPIYVQIVEQVRREVAQGRLNVGDQLPTVRQLATDLRVNFNTVARAYRLLDEAGLISTQRGRGTYIWEQPGEEASLLLRHESLHALTRSYLEEAGRLGFQPSEITNEFMEQVQSPDQRGSNLEQIESNNERKE